MILVFESHPVQYRAPLYRRVHELLGPGAFRVIYGSDFSLSGFDDPEFGARVEWRADLLGGYEFRFLSCLRDPRLSRFRALGGRGVRAQIGKPGVRAVMLTSLRFQFDWTAWLNARCRRIPVLLRQETQDEAFERSRPRSIVRKAIYRLAYSGIDRVLPVGALNAGHYAKFGIEVRPDQFVRYSVPNPLESLDTSEKVRRRTAWRAELGIPQDLWLAGFVGKLIEKKDPALVLESLRLALKSDPGRKMGLVVVGTGPLLGELKTRAEELGLPVWFTGFMDQNAIWNAYLGIDCLMLPSKRMGETWGLVVNEALHAGCSVVVSEAVGCSAEFGDFEHVRVIPVGDSTRAAQCLLEFSTLPRSWDWCQREMRNYSLDASAEALARNMRDYL